MYSPRIREDLIPLLYCIAKEKRQPMTRVVNKWIEERLLLELDTENELEKEWQGVNTQYGRRK